VAALVKAGARKRRPLGEPIYTALILSPIRSNNPLTF